MSLTPEDITVRSVSRTSAIVLGVSLVLGLSSLGFLLGSFAVTVKEYERTVTVKGLAEQEHVADIVIWPIQYTAADNDLGALYATIDSNNASIRAFLESNSLPASAVTLAPPAITDRLAQSYGDGSRAEFRYTATQALTVYSSDIELVRGLMSSLSDLGREGIVFSGAEYHLQPEYLFTRLNDIKPAMIEEATREARAAAIKFADDSNSELGKIRNASQGQFSISNRDRNNPHIKNVRVVVSVEYYLSD
ncbi:MAG TPA: SIMPL domain-containing protein [Pseudohongiella sp.]|nr:SIMPL domain-containing protein [Pseudohongiella sp.]HEA64141.1 SIMPL domain-containing protein [Pseudohongiella sp.]